MILDQRLGRWKTAWRKELVKENANIQDRPYVCEKRDCEKFSSFTYVDGLFQHQHEVHHQTFSTFPSNFYRPFPMQCPPSPLRGRRENLTTSERNALDVLSGVFTLMLLEVFHLCYPAGLTLSPQGPSVVSQCLPLYYSHSSILESSRVININVIIISQYVSNLSFIEFLMLEIVWSELYKELIKGIAGLNMSHNLSLRRNCGIWSGMIWSTENQHAFLSLPRTQRLLLSI